MSRARSEPGAPESEPRPYEVVLVVVDGSPWAAAAVGLAARIAERSRATLHVAGAVLPGGARVALGPAAEVTQPGSHEFAGQLEEHVREVAEEAGSRWRCSVQATMIASPEPEAGADATGWGLPEYERRENVDLTVVGVRPLSGNEGSSSEDEPPRLRSDIADALKSPLLLVPSTDEDIEGAASEPMSLGKLAVVVARGEPSRARHVVRQASRLAMVAGSDLCVIGPRLEGMEDFEVMDAPDGDDGVIRLLEEGIAGTVALASERLGLAERILFEPRADGSRRKGDAGGPLNVLLCPGV